MTFTRRMLIGVFLITLTLYSCVNYEIVEKVPEGATKERILIKSYPTEARIFIDKKYLGKTPVKTDLWYFKPRRVNIIAEPLYKNQIPQNLVIAIPDVPDKIVFYMNFNPERYYYDENQDAAQIFLPVIFFEADTFFLSAEETNKLDELAEYLRQEDGIVLEIAGYAGQSGAYDGDAKEIRLQRALSVYNYLIEQGVAAEKMEALGHGESPLPDSASIEPQYRKDQRVEFTLRNINDNHTR